MYRVPFRDTVELQQRLVATWAEFQQRAVKEACIHAEDGHFEHLL